MKPEGPVSFEGSHLAAGLLVGGPGVPLALARERVLAAWSSGTVVHSLAGEQLLVVFPEPRRLSSRTAGGAIVVAAHGVLAALPLSSGSIAALDPDPRSLVLSREGELVVERLGERTRVDPSGWLDIELEVEDAVPLGPEPERAAAPTAASTDLRAAIGEAIPERAEGALTVKALREGGAGTSLPPRALSWVASAVSWARGLFGALLGAGAGGAAARGTPSRGDPAALAPRTPSAFERLSGWLSRLLMRTRLSRWVTRRHAEYVARMLELFDRGDVREALKWAIPLGGDDEAGGVAIGAPSPRTSLAITLGSGAGPASAISGLPGLYGFLRERYMQMLAKLQESGAIDEAAFVLAELLRDPAGAVALLERHHRYLQAARLADAAHLEPPVRVRTWMLAGNVDHAVRIARQHGGMALAITMLRRAHPEAADALSIAWASSLASSGAHGEAVTVARGIAGTEALVGAWLERGLELGGVPGARLLAMRVALAPARWEDTRSRALALLADASAEALGARWAFAAALSREADTPMVRAIARPVLRALLRDGAPPSDVEVAVRLEGLARDAAWRADRPRTVRSGKVHEKLSGRASPLVIRIEARDVGSIPVRDGALLPSGRMALALGEAGVRLVAKDGRKVAAWATPADDLVVSDAGSRALAVGRCGAVTRVARIDLLAWRSESWWETHLTAFARTFDGSVWLVSERGTAQLMDVLDTGWSALVRVDGPACVVVDRRAHGTEALVVTAEATGLSGCRYDATLTRLRQRTDLAEAFETSRPTQFAGDANLWAICRDDDTQAHQLAFVSGVATTRVPLEGAPVRRGLAVIGTHVAVAMVLSAGVRVDLRSAAGRSLVHVLLDGARDASLRITDDVLVITDDLGRVLVVDVATGALVRDLRVGP